MNLAEILRQWRGGLIVSCQAASGTPLARPDIIAAMARVAELNGAVGVRLDGSDNVKAARQAMGLPILGLEKRIFADSEVYITPTYDALVRLKESGAHIAALDATERPRPRGETLEQIVKQAREQLRIPLMADVATFTQGVRAVEELGAEMVSTTLSGYTRETAGNNGADFQLVEKLASRLSVPVIAEGRLRSPQDVARAFDCGAFAVVVGAAITGLDWLTRQYAQAAPRGRNETAGAVEAGNG